MKTWEDIIEDATNGIPDGEEYSEIDYKQELLDYVNDLDQDESEEVYNIIMKYFDFDNDEDIDEGLLFKTGKAELARKRKANPLAVKLAKRKARLHYKKNKAKIKLKQKLYRHKAKNNKGAIRHHRAV